MTEALPDQEEIEDEDDEDTLGDDGQGECEPVRLTIKRDVLRIGTLSWDGEHGENVCFSGSDFLSALRVARRSMRILPDLILCAGRTVQDGTDAEDVLDATGGVPVLYEALDEDDVPAWWCDIDTGDGPDTFLVRAKQLLTRSSGQPEEYTQLARAISERQGVLWLDLEDGDPIPLVLMICGENNALTAGRKLGLLSDLPRQMVTRADLQAILGGPWIALNPAHKPYWPQIGRAGFTKVGVAGRAGPTLGKAVWSQDPGSFGVRSPQAVVHCNNFLRDEPKTHVYASRVFVPRSVSKSGILTPTTRVAQKETQDSIISWTFAQYELPLR